MRPQSAKQPSDPDSFIVPHAAGISTSSGDLVKLRRGSLKDYFPSDETQLMLDT